MTITPSALTKASGVAAIAAGAIFMGVQIGHPDIAGTSKDVVHNLIVLDTSRGTLHGHVGAIQIVTQFRGFAFLGGGLIFGIALFRAHVLARWACVLLAVGGIISIALSVMPDAFYRLLAFPNSIAMIGLGYSLWRTTRSAQQEASTVTIPAPRSPAPDDDFSATTAAAPMEPTGHEGSAAQAR
jgi:hypothetical protein